MALQVLDSVVGAVIDDKIYIQRESRTAALGGLLQCVTVCCSVLQCVAACCSVSMNRVPLFWDDCRSVLQCVAVCCSVL